MEPPRDYDANRAVQAVAELDPKWPPAKEDRPCCVAKRDDLGRLPIGFCSPECIGRPTVWRAEVERRRSIVLSS